MSLLRGRQVLSSLEIKMTEHPLAHYPSTLPSSVHEQANEEIASWWRMSRSLEARVATLSSHCSGCCRWIIGPVIATMMRNCSVVSKLSMQLSEPGEFLLLLPLAAPVALGRSYAGCAQCNHAFLWQHASWSSFSRGREAWIGPFLRYVFTDSRPCTGFMVHRNSP